MPKGQYNKQGGFMPKGQYNKQGGFMSKGQYNKQGGFMSKGQYNKQGSDTHSLGGLNREQKETRVFCIDEGIR